MGAPRVYIKSNRFYISYWAIGKGEVRSSTGIKVDVPIVDGKFDWKQSKHASKIHDLIDIAAANRTANRHGSPQIVRQQDLGNAPKLEAVLSLYARQWEDRTDSRFEPSTKRKYITSINTLRAFNKHLGLLNTTEDDAKAFKKWLQKKEYEQSTIEGYIRRLRTLWKFAVAEELVSSNPWREIFVRVEAKMIIPLPIAEEKKFFCVLFAHHREAFEFAFMQRMTAYRFSDLVPITWNDIQGDTLYLRNVKMKRPDAYPICNALALVLEKMGKRDLGKGRLFRFNHTQDFNEWLHEASEISGIKRMTSKEFKPNFGQEMDELIFSGQDIADRFIAALMHHQIKGATRMASRHYISHIPRMRTIINEAFEHWHQFVIGLYSDYEAECKKWGVKK